MAQNIFSKQDAYRFLKVEEYFKDYKSWERIPSKVESLSYDKDLDTPLILNFKRENGVECSMLIYILQDDTLRIRFNPTKVAKDYTDQCSPSVTTGLFSDLSRIMNCPQYNNFQRFVEKTSNSISVVTERNKVKSMRLTVNLQPFEILLYNIEVIDSKEKEFLVWSTFKHPFCFTPTGNGQDYSIIQALNKSATSKFVGFGEQGGQSLSKNTAQVNYFNFDNMRYMQVYNKGPLDAREPLYHSEPIFFEYNRVPSTNFINAMFLDNPGQVLMDIGYDNSQRLLVGTRFGDLDFYVFMGDTTAQIIESFTSVVGRSNLKPRYVLGYHQGCYGYDRREIAEWAVDKHRQYRIPLDGLHVDVDIQQDYRTFTIDTSKFPNPKEFFTNLRNKGIKCSTNITPIISCKNGDRSYSTYAEAIDNNYLVTDERVDPDDYEARVYQLYGGGNSYRPNGDYIEGFNSGRPYVGEVYYGQDENHQDLGTPGHYADLARPQVRSWWGRQYQYLFDCGLEFVWQDMTTPAIRDIRGDMKGFPFRLKVSSNFSSDEKIEKTAAIRVWNLYSYNLHRATYNGLARLPGRENKRNFIIGRGSYTGSHRYAGLWTGDNSSDWTFLKMNVSQALSLGMCGVVINGQDIGGFEAASSDGGRWCSPELLIRWTAAGAFLPWFRNHYVRKGRKEFQEPFMFTQWFNQYQGGNIPEPRDLYEAVLPICKHFIELRYKLIQLFYDSLFSNILTGLPICRPLFLNSPRDKALFNDKEEFISNEFYVGNDLLVAPILWPQQHEGVDNQGLRDVYLPSGTNWYTYMNNTQSLGSPIEGGTTIRDFDAKIYLAGTHINFIVPLFIKEGSIIPTVELQQFVGEKNSFGQDCPITISVYPGQREGYHYDMFLDDGVSQSSSPVDEGEIFKNPNGVINKGDCRQVRISHTLVEANLREISIVRVYDNYTPREKYFYVAVLLDPRDRPVTNITVNGERTQYFEHSTPENRASRLSTSSENGWYFNENIRTVFVKVFDAAELRVRVKYQE